MELAKALDELETARKTALDAAVAAGKYRCCSWLDAEGQVQRAINKARRVIEKPVGEKVEKAAKETKSKK
jgi:hypothetical protein